MRPALSGRPGVTGTDVFPPAKRSAVMARVRSRDTGPERVVRRLLTRLGVRYRLHRRDLPGSPDVVMAGRRLAVFVHGCFWHGHDCRRGARQPKANAAYWSAKIARNRARDASASEALSAAGWRIAVVWECELKDEAALTERLHGLTSKSPHPEPVEGRGVAGGCGGLVLRQAQDEAE